MFYKIFYLKGNPNFMYQKRNGVWYKRSIASKEAYYKVDAKGQEVLSNAYNSKNPLYFYSNTLIIGGVALIGAIGYFAFKKYGKRPLF